MRVKNPTYFELLVQFIDDYIDNHGRSPSTREIASGTGLSLSTVSRYLSHMREKGMIEDIVIWHTLIVLGCGFFFIGILVDLMFYWSRTCAALVVLGVMLAVAGVFLYTNPNLF